MRLSRKKWMRPGSALWLSFPSTRIVVEQSCQFLVGSRRVFFFSSKCARSPYTTLFCLALSFPCLALFFAARFTPRCFFVVTLLWVSGSVQQLSRWAPQLTTIEGFYWILSFFLFPFCIPLYPLSSFLESKLIDELKGEKLRKCDCRTFSSVLLFGFPFRCANSRTRLVTSFCCSAMYGCRVYFLWVSLNHFPLKSFICSRFRQRSSKPLCYSVS